MVNKAEHTGLDAANLFVRLLIGSRTLFWLILVFGYELPPEIGVPLNGLCLLIMANLRPNAPFCATMQNDDSRPLFHVIAASIPLVSIIPLAHPQLRKDADICNPLVTWLQVVLGFLLPTAVQLCADYAARLSFVRQYPALLSPGDRRKWVQMRTMRSNLSIGGLAAIIYAHLSTALWYAMMWADVLPLRG